jgi:hypothetical protein
MIWRISSSLEVGSVGLVVGMAHYTKNFVNCGAPHAIYARPPAFGRRFPRRDTALAVQS